MLKMLNNEISIPARNLGPLLAAIEKDCKAWMQNKGITERWLFNSNLVQRFFADQKLDPKVKYAQFYRNSRPTISVSYVWKNTSLSKIADECGLAVYKDETLFIDILILVLWCDVKSEQVMERTRKVFGRGKIMIFVDEQYLTRAWCCLEIAIATSACRELIIVGKSTAVQSRDYYADMDAFDKEIDLPLIQKEILAKFGGADCFNNIVKDAMVTLFVASFRNVECKLYDSPRHQRPEWKAVLQETPPMLKARNKDQDWKVVNGTMDIEAIAPQCRSIRVYLASTLTDAVVEKNFLVSDVEPYLKLLARQFGLDFMFSDMRKGTRDDLDALSPDVLLAELKHCQQASAGLNFIVITGNRYGDVPLPSNIAKEDFVSMLAHLSPEDKDKAQLCYELDRNILPSPRYVLRTPDEIDDFNVLLPILQKSLGQAAREVWPAAYASELRDPRSVHPIKSFFISTLEQEIGHGIFTLCSKESFKCVHVFSRKIELPNDNLLLEEPAWGAFVDKCKGWLDGNAKEMLRQLQGDMLPAFLEGIGCITDLKSLNFDPVHPEKAEHLKPLLDKVCQLAVDSIKNTASKLAVEADQVVDECKQHLKFARDRAERFHATESGRCALERVQEYLNGPGGRALVVWGASGGGKTYVMAKAVHDQCILGKSVVVRFLGTSAKSSDVANLLLSVCQTLRYISMGTDGFSSNDQGSGLPTCPTDIEDLRKYFADALMGWKYCPITLFMDSVNQLSSSYSGLMLGWLPVLGLSKIVHLVISTPPDEPNPQVGAAFRCLSILCKKMVQEYGTCSNADDLETVRSICEENELLFVKVQPLQDAAALLTHLLHIGNRSATDRQVQVALKVVAGSDKTKTPLMVTILANVIGQLPSFREMPLWADSVGENVTVMGIITKFCEKLQSSLGEEFVRNTLSYLNIPVRGVTEGELLDILSIDDDVLSELYLWWNTPQRRMPCAPLTLLLAELKPFLSHRAQQLDGELLSWYHRQFWEAVEAAYLKNNTEFFTERLQVMQDYFIGKWADQPKILSRNLKIRVRHLDENEVGAPRNVRRQPFQVQGKDWQADAVYNDRRCVEVIPLILRTFELMLGKSNLDGLELKAKMGEYCSVAMLEFCSVEGVVARSMTGEIFNLISQFASFEAKLQSASSRLEGWNQVYPELLGHFFRWIRRDAHEFKTPAQVIASLLRQPSLSRARGDYLRARKRAYGIPYAVLGGPTDFDAITMVLKGHKKQVNSVCWSPKDGNDVASASDDGTIIIWNSKTSQLVSTLKGHTSVVSSVAWNSKKSQIASGSSDKTIIIWDAETGEQVRKLEGHRSEVKSVFWSPEGSKIASGSNDSTVIIWDAETGEQKSQLEGHERVVTSVSWSPEGSKIVSGGMGGSSWLDPGEVIVWDAMTGVQKCQLKGHTAQVNSVSWSPDQEGSKIASGSDDSSIIIWDAETGEQKVQLKGHQYGVRSVAWSPDGSKIASGSYDNTVIIWDAETGEQKSQLKGHTEGVLSVSWSPEGSKIASGSSDKTVIIWDAETGEQKTHLKGHTITVTSVSWSPEGSKIASGSVGKAIIIWDALTGEQKTKLKGHTDYVLSVAWSPDGSKIVSGSEDRTVIIWDAETGEQKIQLKGHTDYVTSVAWSPEASKIASGSYDNTVIIWDAETGEQKSQLKGHTNWLQSVAWSPEGSKITSGSDDGTVIIWDAESGEPKSQLEGHEGVVTSVAWSPEGSKIVSGGGSYGSPGEIIIWDAETGEQKALLKGHTNQVTSVAWSPEGSKITSGSSDETVIIWDAETGEQKSKLKGHTGTVRSVDWSPEGSKIASGSIDHTVIIWDAVTGEQKSQLEGHTAGVMSVVWSPEDSKIASGSSDNTIIIWDAVTGEQKSQLKGHSGAVQSVAWGRSGNQLASGSSDKSVIIWDASNGKQVSKLKGHTDFVRSVEWNFNGDKLASGSDDRTVIIWDALNGQQLLKLEGHTDYVMSVAWSPQGHQLASGSKDKTVIIWSAVGQQLLKLEGHTDVVSTVAWSLSGDRLASGSYDKSVIIWDQAKGQPVSKLEGHSSAVRGVVWNSNGGKLASSSDDKTVIIWDAGSGNQIAKLEGHTADMRSVAWSPKGDRLASGSSDKTLIIWDAMSGHHLWRLEGHTRPITCVAWSPMEDPIGASKALEASQQTSELEGCTGQHPSVAYEARVASGSDDNSVLIWDAENGKEILKLREHTASVTSLAWSQNGSLLASGSDDKSVIIWNANTGKRVFKHEGHSSAPVTLAWSENDEKLTCGLADGTVSIWNAGTGERSAEQDKTGPKAAGYGSLEGATDNRPSLQKNIGSDKGSTESSKGQKNQERESLQQMQEVVLWSQIEARQGVTELQAPVQKVDTSSQENKEIDDTRPVEGVSSQTGIGFQVHDGRIVGECGTSQAQRSSDAVTGFPQSSGLNQANSNRCRCRPASTECILQ